MRKFSGFSGVGFAGALLLCAVACLWTAAPAGAQTGDQYCEIQLSRCPNEYDGVTLQVPLSVVSLSAQIRACADTTLQTVRISKPAAVMFVIDHSTSMVPAGANPQECPTTGCDQDGNRYRVTKEIIDSINAINPESEVGIVVFSNGLVLDSDRDNNLVRFADAYPYDTARGIPGIRQSYMPLKQLKATAKTGGNAPFYEGAGGTIYDVYRNMFVQNAGAGWGIKGGPGEISGTNISLAFAAALKAFESTNIEKDNQFIVFISDGTAALSTSAPAACPNNTWCDRVDEFQTAVANTPTTYTVFLRPGANAQVPPSIRTMTANISTNGYSASNSSSAAVAINSNYQTLLDTLKNMILKNMPVETRSNARRISVTSVGRTDSTDNVGDTGFTFNRMLPIDTSELAPVKMGITYMVQGDTLLPDGRDSSYSFYKVNEYNFQIQRTASPPRSWIYDCTGRPAGCKPGDPEQGLEASCGGKPKIELLDRANNKVDTIKANITELTLKFTGSTFFDYKKDNIVIRVRTTEGANQDTLYTNADKSVPTHNGYILPQPREQAGPSFYWDFERKSTPTINNSNIVLEHNTLKDFVEIYYYNPYIPLDTLWLRVPYISHEMVFSEKGDNVIPIPNPVYVKAGEPLDIYALLLNEAGSIDTALLNKGNVTWTLSSTDGASITPESTRGSSPATFLGTKAKADSSVKYVVTARFVSDDKNMIIEEKFTVVVIPGAAAYLEVVFVDPSKAPDYADTTKLKEPKKLEIPKNRRDTTLYVVARDQYGNLIGPADNSSWEAGEGSSGINVTGNPGGVSGDVGRASEAFSGGNKVIVTKSGLTAVVDVKVLGDASITIGPPFVPGVDKADRVFIVNGVMNENSKIFYKDILAAPAVGGGASGGFSCTDCGILVAGTAPDEIKSKNGKNPTKATVIIYDAVGNIVFRSKPSDITLVQNNTFGFIWNGKNEKGRTVGPGTYLVRTSVELDAGRKFVQQRKIGVTR